MNITKEEKWKCPHCDSFLDNEQDANDCCPHIVKKIDCYICGECEELYTDKKEAQMCCRRND